MSAGPAIDSHQQSGFSSARLGRYALVVLGAALVATYLVDLRRTPVYFGGDEAHFAVIGQSLATDGTSLVGDRWPVFVRLDDPAGPQEPLPWGTTWYQPLLFYVVALVLKVLPLTEATVRLPMAIVGGIINPLLMFAVGRRLFRHDGLAALGAALLLLSPAHLILSRQALDYVAPLPFVLAWFWCVLTYVDSRQTRFALAGGVVLGLGCYSYIASWGLMPGFLALSGLAYWWAGGRWMKATALSAAGFATAVVPAVVWLSRHQEMLVDTVRRYQVAEDGGGQVLSDSGFGISRVAELVSIYWDYFDPAYLFLLGGPSMTTSTGRVGVFLLPVAILLPLGLFAMLSDRQGAIWKFIILAGFLAAPLPAALRGVPSMVQRELLIQPFAALICVYGAAFLRQFVPKGRVVVAVGLSLMVLQYGVFARDYWTHYKLRSAFYYDSIAFAAVADTLLGTHQAGAAPAVYFSADLDDVAPKWRFYLTKSGRTDLLERTHYLAPDDDGPDVALPGSLWVLHNKAAQLKRMEERGLWAPLAIVADVDSRPAAVILRRGDRQP